MRPISGPATLTHARLRVSQGDLQGARRVVRAVLVLRPHDGEAQRLLAELEQRPAARGGAVSPRIQRLRQWLERIERGG